MDAVKFDALLRYLGKIPCAGIFLALVSGIIFATAGFTVKLLPQTNPLEIVVIRSIVQMIILMPIICFTGTPVCGVPGERLILALRAVISSIGFLAYYAAVHMIPLPDAITIDNSSSAFVYIFACIYLREECAVFQILTVTATMTGVLLIAKPTFLFGDLSDHSSLESNVRTLGIILAVGSCLATANAIIMMRRMIRTSALTNANAYSFASIIAGISAILFLSQVNPEEDRSEFARFEVPVSAYEMTLLIVNGVLGVIGQLVLNTALKLEDASLVSLARTIDIVTAFVYQTVWIPDETVHWTSILGAVIVVSSVSTSAIRRWLSDKPGKWNIVWILINCGVYRERKLAEQEDDIELSQKIGIKS